MTATLRPVTAPEPGAPRTPKWGKRVAVFAAVLVVCAAVGVGYIVRANRRVEDAERNAEKVPVATGQTLAEVLAGPHVLARSTALGDDYGKVGVVALADPAGPRVFSDLKCERVDFRAGRGVCLRADRGVLTTYEGIVFDETLTPIDTFDLAGAPSRVRISPDGKWAGFTVFVTGHSYAELGFSTQTNILNLETGELLPNLEEFDVRNNGSTVTAIDRNYWGVTFKADTDGFYATLGTSGKTYLIEGDISDRSANVIAEDVECPSLSPDGTRIAFKERRSGPAFAAVTWGIAVLDLTTGERWSLPESRNVDDQVAWADNDTIIYGLPTSSAGSAETDIWAVPADGSGQPTLWMPRAWSPSVVAQNA